MGRTNFTKDKIEFRNYFVLILRSICIYYVKVHEQYQEVFDFAFLLPGKIIDS